MSIIEMPKWMPGKKRSGPDEFEAQLNRGAYRIPEDMMHELDQALAADKPPLGTPVRPPRTAQVIAADIAHYKAKLAEGEAWLAKGKIELAEFEAELTAKIDEEKAAIRAEHRAKLTELEKLKAGSTGEPT